MTQITPNDRSRSYKTFERAEQAAQLFFDGLLPQEQRTWIHWVIVPTATGDGRWTVVVFLMRPEAGWAVRSVAEQGWLISN